MKQFIEGFAEFYPCKFCKAHFQRDLKDSPADVSGRDELSLWLCKQHNKTNILLGKEEFSCDMETLQKRWLKNPECLDKGY